MEDELAKVLEENTKIVAQLKDQKLLETNLEKTRDKLEGALKD